MNKIEILLQDIFLKDNSLLQAVVSNPLQKTTLISKVTIRPVTIKKKLLYQVTEYRTTQTFHQNMPPDECLKYLLDALDQFKQALICTAQADYHILMNKKKQSTLLTKPPSKGQLTLSHNRAKQYLLPENKPIPFLIELGIMGPSGNIIASKRDKFKQLNRFLEMIADVLPQFDKKKPIHIIDFGCGKAYLTFALYYFMMQEGYLVNLQGLDLKQSVIDHCQQLADTLGYTNLHFAVGDINHFQPTAPVDMVITLHACDTATDAALEKAIRWKAKVILCVPCCQHELFTQVQNDMLSPILQHGILKERFAALATDAARAQLLEILGYQTQVLEFIDMEHTPKNLLIRAIKREYVVDNQAAIETYRNYKNALGITPSLERRFLKEIS